MRWIAAVVLLAWSARADRAVVLVPGTFNSITFGHYFSDTIIRTLERQGFTVHVVGGLEPAGEFETNGMTTLESIRDWYRERFPKGGVPISIIGHSAGGFYSLYAATLGRDLPIEKIVLLSTPLEGSLLAQRVIPDTLKYLDGPLLDLRGLPQIKPANVKKFLHSVRVDSNIKIYAVGSSQPFAKLFENHLNSKFLSIALSVAGKVIGEECDGIIERSSAYGPRTSILSDNGEPVEIHRLDSIHGRLEHTEQVLDYRVFLLGATMNTRFIDEEQKRMFTNIGRIIVDPGSESR